MQTAGNSQKVYRMGQSSEGYADPWDTQTLREEVYITISCHNYIIYNISGMMPEETVKF
jgi:hypothetical protein